MISQKVKFTIIKLTELQWVKCKEKDWAFWHKIKISWILECKIRIKAKHQWSVQTNIKEEQKIIEINEQN